MLHFTGVLTWAFGLFFRKIGWIKENDLSSIYKKDLRKYSKSYTIENKNNILLVHIIKN